MAFVAEMIACSSASFELPGWKIFLIFYDHVLLQNTATLRKENVRAKSGSKRY